MKRPPGEERKEIPQGGRRSAAQMCRSSEWELSSKIPLQENWSMVNSSTFRVFTIKFFLFFF